MVLTLRMSTEHAKNIDMKMCIIYRGLEEWRKWFLRSGLK